IVNDKPSAAKSNPSANHGSARPFSPILTNPSWVRFCMIGLNPVTALAEPKRATPSRRATAAGGVSIGEELLHPQLAASRNGQAMPVNALPSRLERLSRCNRVNLSLVEQALVNDRGAVA